MAYKCHCVALLLFFCEDDDDLDGVLCSTVNSLQVSVSLDSISVSIGGPTPMLPSLAPSALPQQRAFQRLDIEIRNGQETGEVEPGGSSLLLPDIATPAPRLGGPSITSKDGTTKGAIYLDGTLTITVYVLNRKYENNKVVFSGPRKCRFEKPGSLVRPQSWKLKPPSALPQQRAFQSLDIEIRNGQETGEVEPGGSSLLLTDIVTPAPRLGGPSITSKDGTTKGAIYLDGTLTITV
ncbi:hypothetical protein WH47_00567 [Habropoda laboriosa]|uniref:Uncharacterized protein n=1 Tax=Habropoda laboriosa TaxID=597456 RepID=A0A0L7QK45_9HYME|nr:hypothetical protein WH47_00567 [Habropoda laboriosa]